MNYIFLFLLLSCLHRVFCNLEEDNWKDLENGYLKEIEMERNDMEEALRAPKALSIEGGCVVTDAPSLQNYTCDERGCFTKHMARGQMSYNGSLATTVSGKTCKVWSTIDPGPYAIYIKYGTHNYCRGSHPDPDWVFCFTTDPNTLYEKCDVPRCLTLTKGEYCKTCFACILQTFSSYGMIFFYD